MPVAMKRSRSIISSTITQSSASAAAAPPPPASASEDHIQHSKRQKIFSTPAATGPSSKHIDHLPECLLVEILCRLPCFKSVSQCKLVSKRWCTLPSDPHFIRRFLCLQRSRKKKPIGTAISIEGEEFLNRVSPSSRPLAHLFERLVSIHGLKQEPVVAGTYNDLVLCCASMYSQRDYYICNPYTLQWVPLPPPPKVYEYVAVGFACDFPYYKYRRDDEQGDIMELNADYKYRVVRLIDFGDADNFDNYDKVSCEFEAQIFFSETGEWREFILSSPSAFPVGQLSGCIGVASNRMLYWLSHEGDFVVGLDPFVINHIYNTSSSSTRRRSVFISECDEWDGVPVECLVTVDGCLRMCEYDPLTRTLSIWELNQEKEDDETVMMHGGADNLFARLKKRVSLADEEMVVIRAGIDKASAVVFDPNNEDMLYMLLDNLRGLSKKKDIIRCNIRTGEVSTVATNQAIDCVCQFPFVLPWWPTPVPQLPQRGQPSPNLPT